MHMVLLRNLFSILFVAASLFYSSADVVTYTVTFISCAQNSTCPQGNPVSFNATFALNGTLSPNLTLKVGDQLIFNLATNVSNHPLLVCRNSTIPKFCQGTNSSDQLNTPITQAGTNASVTFNMSGMYYYGCKNHPGMGATINIIQTPATTSPPKGTGTRNKLSAWFLHIATITIIGQMFF